MPPKRVLITRSVLENEILKAGINQNHFEVISWNLISYKNLEYNLEVLLQNYNNIIITSKYAANLMPRLLKQNIWVVGSKSAEILTSKGLNICYIAKNVDDLIRTLPEIPNDQIIYLSGNKITQNMPQGVKRQIIYKVQYKSTLTTKEINDIKQGIDYILLYSRLCAKSLLKLLHRYELLKYLRCTNIIAISEKVADIVRLYFKNVIYCKDENYDQILELLENGRHT